MQFSDTSTSQGVLQEVHFLCKSDSTSYPTNDIVRNANRWLYRAVSWVMEASPDWEFDDQNHTTHPTATADLVASQSDYSLPTNLLRLNAVFVKDSAGNYQKLRSVTESDFADDLSVVFPTAGMPEYYDVVGGSIFLYPSPAAANVTTTAGLKLSVLREVDAFTNADTTQESPLTEPFDRIISYGASYDYLIVNGPMDRAQAVRAEIEAMKQDLTRHFRGKNKGRKTSLKTAHERNRSQIL